jgi:antitoxin component YwqK of YwqJK toxin-antitoxin module
MKKLIIILLFSLLPLYMFSQNDSITIKSIKIGNVIKITSYDSNNNVLSFARYKNGKKDGKWIIKDENLIVRYEMYYNNGKRVGKWKMYNELGKLKEVKNFNK